MFIVGIGIIAALNQIGVATTVTMPILIAVLATIGGILIVGVGGGMVRPMQQRWERWLGRAEQESTILRERVQAQVAQSRREAMSADTTTAFATGDQQPLGDGPTTSFATGTQQQDVSDAPNPGPAPEQQPGTAAIGDRRPPAGACRLARAPEAPERH